MTNKKITIGAAALVAIIASAGFAMSTFAYQGDPNAKGPNYNEERHEAMLNAFENKDYNAWKEARGDFGKGRIMDQVNEDNFSKFVEMRELRLAGDIDGADALREDLGLGQGMMRHGHGKGQGRRGDGNNENRGQNRGGNFVDDNDDEICDLAE